MPGDQIGKEEAEKEAPCTFLRLFFEEGRQVLKPSMLFEQKTRPRGIRHDCGRVVLIGGPGHGKTTQGLCDCQLFGAALLLETAGTYRP
jgi:hypothetical protein